MGLAQKQPPRAVVARFRFIISLPMNSGAADIEYSLSQSTVPLTRKYTKGRCVNG